MPGSLTVLLNIIAMFLVILLGWLARRRGYLTEETTGTLSRFVVDITVPALVFTQMLSTIDPGKLQVDWYIPLLGIAIILLGLIVGLLTAPFFSRRTERPTYIFLAAVGNWIYLPLPIVLALYGNYGVTVILLYNVGTQLALWTVGVWTLQGGSPDWKSMKELAINPGLIATAIGILVALLSPDVQVLANADSLSQNSAGILAFGVFLRALKMVGSLTIPLSLVVTGAQLGGLDLTELRPSYTLIGAICSRLLVTPLVALGIIVVLYNFGYHFAEIPLMVGFIIASMPAAISCSIFTERFGGDTSLAARTIFFSTLFSCATVPALFWIIQRMGIVDG